MKETVAIFGESECGKEGILMQIDELGHLVDLLGNPTENSLGVPMAIQSCLYERRILFYQIKEEGFTIKDYMEGFQLIKQRPLPCPLSAIALPGVGDSLILDEAKKVCDLYKCFLIMNESDLFDYLTQSNP